MALLPLPADWPKMPDIPPLDFGPAGPQPIPEPTTAEDFSIGQALYDPSRAADGVATLIYAMGLGIVAADGSVVRQGTVREDLWPTEATVRGLIQMASEDAAAGTDGTMPYTFSDLGNVLVQSFPGWTVGQLGQAYTDAYANNLDDLVPNVMLGQPIEASTTLSRTQLWLLLMDGIYNPNVEGGTIPFAPIAQARANWGTAQQALPQPVSPDPRFTWPEWQQLLSIVPVVGLNMPFDILPASQPVHEGHGGLGPTVNLTPSVQLSGPTYMSSTTNQALIAPRTVPAIQGTLKWTSPDAALLAKHGTLDRTLGQTIPFTSGPSMRLGYQTRKEPADGHGFLVRKPATLQASVPMRDLVLSAYDIPPAAQGLLLGDRTERARVDLGWHSAGIDLALFDTYDIRLTPTSGLDFAFGGNGHTAGVDGAHGFLELQDDGTYNGLLSAVVNSSFDGDWGGQGCVRNLIGSQTLYVTGTPIGNGNLQLRFYPTAARPQYVDLPGSNCQGDALLGYQGQDAAGNVITGWYLPFANARWNYPEIGYSVYLPSDSNPEWVYEDDDENSEYGTSVWRIKTTLVKGP